MEHTFSHNAIDWPVCTINTLYHIGTLNPKDKQKGSHEGSGLSITTHPHEWKQIYNRISGQLYACGKSNHMFLNAHALTSEQIATITAWGVENGWIVPTEYYRAYNYDSEHDELFYSIHPTYDEAEYEIDEPDEDNRVEHEPNGFIMTERMKDACMSHHLMHEPTHLLFTLFAEHELNIDGVWWEDILDVYAYSAPRGVINTKHLSEWTFTPTKKGPSYYD